MQPKDQISLALALAFTQTMDLRLYVKRAYIPDGHGATYNYKYVTPGKEYLLDDDLVLWFTKKLN